jgi:hypothetical protein
MKKLAMASFDFVPLSAGLERPGAFDAADQHWPRCLEAVGLVAHGLFLQRRDREGLDEAFCGFGPTSTT